HANLVTMVVAFVDKRPDGDARMVSAIFDSIAHQILEALREGRRVADDLGKIGLDVLLDGESGMLDGLARVAQHGFDDLWDLQGPEDVVRPALFVRSEKQNLVYQFSQLSRLIANH